MNIPKGFRRKQAAAIARRENRAGGLVASSIREIRRMAMHEAQVAAMTQADAPAVDDDQTNPDGAGETSEPQTEGVAGQTPANTEMAEGDTAIGAASGGEVDGENASETGAVSVAEVEAPKRAARAKK
jgi:hypothetical protein